MNPNKIEDVDTFRTRVRSFIGQHLDHRTRSISLRGGDTDEQQLAGVEHDREMQRSLFDAGLAGICFPREYGGQGLIPAHQAVLNEELVSYDYPAHLQSPSISQCAPVILSSAPKSKNGNICRASFVATRSGPSSSLSPAAVPTSPVP